MQHNKTGHRNAGRSPAAPRRKLLNRKQAEYLATAIEKGLVVSAEELSRRVWSERQIAKEREDRSNRHAACIGSLYSSTWPSGGERLRTQGEHAAVRRQQKQGEEERERKESAKSPQLSPMSSPRRSIVSYDLLLKQLSPKALTSPEPTQPAFIGQFSTKNARGTTPDIFPPPKQLSEYSLSLAGARSLTSVRIRKEGLMDQEPWKRVNKPRALTVQEQARVKVYCSQCHLFSGLQLQDGGVAIRPLHQLDLLQVVDGFKADADALARQRIQTKSEKTRDNANLANVKLGSDAAPGTNESDASSANDWLQGLLDKPQNALELLEQLQEHDAAVVYSIVDVATGRSVGVMSLGDNAPQSLRIDIARIVLPRSLCTSTVMVQTLHLILEHIFEKIQYVRVQISICASSPLASQLLQLGFKYEGIKRGAFLCKDLLVFRMLDSDWLCKGKSACTIFLEDDQRSSRRSPAAELANFWHHTQKTRDVLMEGNQCLQRLTATALMEQIVTKVAALTIDAVRYVAKDRHPKSFSRCKGAQDREKPAILIGQKGFRTGELIGNNVVLQTLQAHGGLYDGYYSSAFSKLSPNEELWRYAELPRAPGEGLLQQYLWKLQQQDPTTFALRVGVKGDGKPRDTISRAELQPVGYIFGRVSKFPCRCLELGPVYLEKADEFEETEAWQLLLQHAFDAGIKRVELLVDTAASSTCVKLLRVGFVFEATHHQFHINQHHINSAVCFAIGAADRAQVATLQSRRLTSLVKSDNNQCLFAAHSHMLEVEVAFKNAAVGIELSDDAPIFVKSIHPTKGVGLPATLTQAANAETGPFLVAVEGRDASGLTRKQVLELLRKLPRPVTLTFRVRAQRPQGPVLTDAAGGYKTVLGARATMLSEMFKRDHPGWYRKTKGGFEERTDRHAHEIQVHPKARYSSVYETKQ